MNENLINSLGSKIHKLRTITVVNNNGDSRNLDLLVQNLISIQQVLKNEKESSKNTKYLNLFEKEADHFLRRYSK